MSYTVANYKTMVRTRLQNITVDDAALLQFANDANREIVNYDASVPGLVWPFMQDNFVGTLATGELRYDFETNWQRPVDMTLIAPDNSAIYPTYMEYEQYRQKHIRL